MASIDIGKAATAGIGVIARRPVAVLAWAVVLLVLGVLPVVGMMSTVVTGLIELIQADQAGVEPSPDAVFSMMSGMIAMQPIVLITGLAVRAILAAAVFRAVLEPDNSRWFYLRFGAQELWVGLMIVVLWVLMSVLSYPLAIVMMPVMMFAAMSAQDNPLLMILPTVVVVLAMLAGFAFLAVRFSLALPMTFAQKQFRLFESWTMTRGQTWRLIGVGAVLVAIVLAIELLVALVFVAVSFGLHGAGGFDEAAMTAFFAQDASIWLAELAPWAIGVAVLGAILGAVVTTVVTAPWAEAYRQLAAAKA